MIVLARHGYSTRFSGMFILTVAAFSLHQIPTIVFYQLDNISNLHPRSLRLIISACNKQPSSYNRVTAPQNSQEISVCPRSTGLVKAAPQLGHWVGAFFTLSTAA